MNNFLLSTFIVFLCFSQSSKGEDNIVEYKLLSTEETLSIENIFSKNYISEDKRKIVQQEFNKKNFTHFLDEKLNINYSNKILMFKIKNNEGKKNIFIDALSPGKILILNSKFETINSYGYKNSKNKGYHPIFDISKEKEIFVIRKSNLRFDGVVSFPSELEVEYYTKYNNGMTLIFIGSFLFLLLYHLGYFVISKNKNYLFYVIFNSSYFVIISTFGLVFNYYFKTNVIEENLMFFTGLTAFFSSLFARNFLDFKKHITTRRYRILIFIEILLASFSFVYLLTDNNYFIKPIFASIIDLFVIVSIFNVIYISFKIRKNNTMSYFYLISWGFLFSGVFLLYAYEYFNLFSEYFIIRYTLMIGCGVEMIVNSFGLAYKLRIIENEKTKAKLEANEKRRYQNLLRIVSHDISNPLTSARMSLDCKDMLPDFETNISDSLDKIEKIIENIRVEEKTNSNSKGSISGFLAYKSLLKSFDLRLKEKNISLVYKGNKNTLIPINENVFLTSLGGNLLSNAIKFSFKNSQIVFDVKEENDYIIVSMEDFGSGMPKDVYEKVLRGEMVTTKGLNNEEGTGFGTNIIRGLMDDYEGKLDVETKHQSEDTNHGTKFILSFPKIN